MPTCRLVPMPASAVAMIELLTGLSADPPISGARNRQPKGLRAAGWASWVMTGHAFVVLSRAVRRRQAWLRRPPASGRAAAGPRRAGWARLIPGGGRQAAQQLKPAAQLAPLLRGERHRQELGQPLLLRGPRRR